MGHGEVWDAPLIERDVRAVDRRGSGGALSMQEVMSRELVPGPVLFPSRLRPQHNAEEGPDLIFALNGHYPLSANGKRKKSASARGCRAPASPCLCRPPEAESGPAQRPSARTHGPFVSRSPPPRCMTQKEGKSSSGLNSYH